MSHGTESAAAPQHAAPRAAGAPAFGRAVPKSTLAAHPAPHLESAFSAEGRRTLICDYCCSAIIGGRYASGELETPCGSFPFIVCKGCCDARERAKDQSYFRVHENRVAAVRRARRYSAAYARIVARLLAYDGLMSCGVRQTRARFEQFATARVSMLLRKSRKPIDTHAVAERLNRHTVLSS